MLSYFLLLLTILFIGLKLTKKINWPWWKVLMPLWTLIIVIIVLLIALSVLVLSASCGIIV